jgi:hypothetical protein
MIIDAAFGQLLHFAIQGCVVRQIEIGNFTAGFADKMIMRLRRAVVAILRAAHLKLANHALRDENIEIAINVA